MRDGQIRFKDVTPTAHLSNHWTAGASLAWYPAFVAAHAVARGDGFQVVYVAAVAFTSALAGLFTMLAAFHVLVERRALARRNTKPAENRRAEARRSTGTVAIACVAVWFGSPLAFYSLRHATMSHAVSAAACAAVVLLSLRLRDAERAECHPERSEGSSTPQRRRSFAVFAAQDDTRGGTWDLLALGMSIGFACAVRPQNVVIALVPLLLVPRVLRGAHLVIGGALVAALPQLIVSQTLWGAPLAFVNIGGRAHPWQMFATFRPFETLFSWYHGLATWTPLLVLAIAGLFALAKSDRGLARAGLVTFAAQWMLLSILERWFWGGASFGQRRFDSLTIFFILGLAALLERLPRWLGVTLTVVTTGWTMMLFVASARLNLNRYQTPADLLEAFRTAVAEPQWRSILGYTPPHLRLDVLIGAAIATAVFALIAFTARRYGTALALAYFVAMSALFAWCGAHPKRDAFSRALVATPMPSGSAIDTITLLRYEADYMERTGRPAAAAKARAEAAAIRP